MKSIKGRLVVVFLSVIAALIIAGLAFFLLLLQATNQYKFLSDTMIAEYRLVDSSAVLIDAFNTRVKSAGTNAGDSTVRIQNAKLQVQQLTNFLDISIQDRESASNYLGFKGSIETLTKEIDMSIAQFEQGGIKDYVTDYNEANKDYNFVRDNGTVLIFSQLKYMSSVRDAINRMYLFGLYSGLGLLFVLIVGSILFVLGFANHLTRPIRSLTQAAKQIAEGNMDFPINQRILEESNEIGILARSFDSMERRLREKMTLLDASNKEMTETAQIVTTKNAELERLNSFMVDRELKMIELKKDLEALKAKNTSTS